MSENKQRAMERISKEELERVNEIISQNNDMRPSQAVEEVRKQDPNKKKYLILYYMSNEEDEEKSWEITTGREETYKFIKDRIEYMDIHNSIVVSGTVTLNDAIEQDMTVYQFMKLMMNYFDDSFDIEDYNKGDEDIQE